MSTSHPSSPYALPSHPHPRLAPPALVLKPPTPSEQDQASMASDATPPAGRFSKLDQRHPPNTNHSNSSNRSSCADARSRQTLFSAPGRKRRRLQKACVACHRAKRRCDGFLPCSNCDFTGRQCVYSDANGNPVPPPPRAPEARDAGRVSAAAYIASINGGAAGTAAAPTSSSASPSSPSRPYAPLFAHATASSPDTALSTHIGVSPDVDADLQREFVEAFFTHLHPFSLLFHRPTFFRHLHRAAFSPLLLHALYAVSARLLPSLADAHRAGDAHARFARALLFSPERPGSERTPIDAPALDTAQALLLLALHELGMARLERAWAYLGICVRMIAAFGLPSPPRRKRRRKREWGEEEDEEETQDATVNRLFWLAWTLDALLASLLRRPRAFSPDDVARVPLPSADDASFHRRPHPDAYIRSSLAEQETVSEFGLLVRVVDLFARVNARWPSPSTFSPPSPSPSPSSSPAVSPSTRSELAECHRALAAWRASVPCGGLVNAAAAAAATGTLRPEAWCYSFMHAIALCVELRLCEVNAEAKEKRRAVVAELINVLESFVPTGFKSPLLAYPLHVCHQCQASSPDGRVEHRLLAWKDALDTSWRLPWDQLFPPRPSVEPCDPTATASDQGQPFYPALPPMHFSDRPPMAAASDIDVKRIRSFSSPEPHAEPRVEPGSPGGYPFYSPPSPAVSLLSPLTNGTTAPTASPGPRSPPPAHGSFPSPQRAPHPAYYHPQSASLAPPSPGHSIHHRSHHSHSRSQPCSPAYQDGHHPHQHQHHHHQHSGSVDGYPDLPPPPGSVLPPLRVPSPRHYEYAPSSAIPELAAANHDDQRHHHHHHYPHHHHLAPVPATSTWRAAIPSLPLPLPATSPTASDLSNPVPSAAAAGHGARVEPGYANAHGHIHGHGHEHGLGTAQLPPLMGYLREEKSI